MRAQAHPRQAERLNALYGYEILDTDRERDFDEIVQLAAALCGTAISVVNFIDLERQWFKAEIGLGVRETPLETSLCSHAILENEFLEIADTLADPRMADNPLCTGDPGLRFYAGALLTTDSGLPLGTLCVLDHAPKSLSKLQRDALRVLARQVMVQLEMRKALRATKLLRQEVDHRVKNSLHSLSAYARLQARTVVTDDARAALAAMGNRIAAVATLHEQLYLTDAGPSVGLARYVESLCDHMATGAPLGVRLTVSATPVTVESRHAVAVGTMINEFVANAYKHAFPHGRGGEVEISVHRQADGRVRVVCRDNGVGLPDDIDQSSAGIGMKIAEVICMELSCTLEVDNRPDGLTLSFAFAPNA